MTTLVPHNCRIAAAVGKALVAHTRYVRPDTPETREHHGPRQVADGSDAEEVVRTRSIRARNPFLVNSL